MNRSAAQGSKAGAAGSEGLAQPASWETSRPPRRRRKQFLRWTLAALAALLIAALGLFVTKDALLRFLVMRSLREKTGLAVEMGGLKLGLATASLRVMDCKIINRPEFGGMALLDMPELFLELDTQRSEGGRLYLKQLRLHVAELNVVRARDGRINLQAFEEAAPGASTNAAPRARGRFQFGGLDKMYLSLGRVNYTDLQEPAKSRVFDLGIQNELVENIRSPDEANQWVGAFLFRLIVREAFKGKDRRIELTIDGEPQK